VSDTTGLNIISYDLAVTYNPAVITPASPAYDTTGTLSSTMLITANTANSGHLIISGFQATSLVGAGTLINLKFNVVGSAGQVSPLVFQDYTDPGNTMHPGFSFNEGDPPALTFPGSVCVTASLTGNVTGRVLTAAGAGIRNAKVVISGGSLTAPRTVTTGSFGYYDFDGLDLGQTYTVTVNSKIFRFTPATRVVSAGVSTAVPIDFVAAE